MKREKKILVNLVLTLGILALVGKMIGIQDGPPPPTYKKFVMVDPRNRVELEKVILNQMKVAIPRPVRDPRPDATPPMIMAASGDLGGQRFIPRRD